VAVPLDGTTYERAGLRLKGNSTLRCTDSKALESTATTRLRAELYARGVAQASLERWSALLATDAGALLDASTLATEKAAIATYFD
jgi:hypothetical protein